MLLFHLLSKMLLHTLITASLLFAAIPHYSQNRQGAVFNPQNPKEVLFQFKQSVRLEENGSKTVSADYLLPSGKMAVSQKVLYQGEDLKLYQLTQHQTGEDFRVEVKENKLHFTRTEGEEKSYKVRNFEKNTFVIDQLPNLLRQNWSQVLEGKEVEFDLIVVTRSRTVGFEFTYEKETTYQNQPAVVIQMKPSNFLIRMLVKPIYLTFAKNGKRELLESKGWLPVKVQKGGEWEEVEAPLVFQSPS